MTSPRELEAKFEADDAAIKRLLALQRFGDFRLIEQDTNDQDDLYYDTVAGRLRDAGASLRIRRKASGALMTFKGERQSVRGTGDHVVSRIEDEVELDAGLLSGLADNMPLVLSDDPQPLQRGRSIAGSQELIPTARLLTERVVLLFVDPEGDRVELAIDRCRAVRLADQRTVVFAEVELELKNGDVTALIAAVRALQVALPGLTPSSMTKLQRALG